MTSQPQNPRGKSQDPDQQRLLEKGDVGGLALPDVHTYHEATAVGTVWCCGTGPYINTTERGDLSLTAQPLKLLEENSGESP